MKKIVRDMPIDGVAEEIAEVKKCSFSEVWDTCGKNAVEFFRLAL